MFRKAFKYYKSRDPPADFSDVVDFGKPNYNKVRKLNPRNVSGNNESLGLIPIEEWNIYELLEVPGLIFIENAFTAEGQCYWIKKCLVEYSTKPSKLNIDAHQLLNNDETWWDVCFGTNGKPKPLLSKLRWATLGYHHNWDTKRYSEESKSLMPPELQKLTSLIGDVIGFPGFQAEAAIVNYYRMNSTLAGHTDHSELNMEAPLFSISFGQMAVFLVGGPDQEDPVVPLFLRSGDVLVMSGSSRLRYHGVPRILETDIQPWDSPTSSDHDFERAKTYIGEARINLNIRQVLRPGQESLY